VQQTWDAMRSRAEVTIAERADVLLAASNATRSAATAVDIVYTAAGATANYRRSPLQRALRDIHAVTQHIATAPSQYESAGRMLMGLQPLSPRILLWVTGTPGDIKMSNEKALRRLAEGEITEVLIIHFPRMKVR
jgi:Acyl-CoA dehydrogenase, C-terminal domain